MVGSVSCRQMNPRAIANLFILPPHVLRESAGVRGILVDLKCAPTLTLPPGTRGADKMGLRQMNRDPIVSPLWRLIRSIGRPPT